MAEFNANNFGSQNSRTVHQQQWFELTVPEYENLTFAIQSLPLFTEGNEAVEVHYANSKVYQAGKATFEGGSFTFMDLMTLGTRTDLYNWRERVYNKTVGTIGWQEDYKKDVEVNLYGPDGTTVSSWKIHGAWPSNVNWGNLDYNSTDKSNVEVTITFDWGEKTA